VSAAAEPRSIESRLVDFVQTEIVLSSDPIDVDTDLLLTGAVDSLGVIRITQWIEDELGILVEPGDVTLENFQTVSRMASYVSGRDGVD